MNSQVEWKIIGKNPYGEIVESLSSGVRRVATEKGWVKESEVESWRACRFTNQEDAKKLMRSLATPSISESFAHNIKKAYCLFRLTPKQPLNAIPNHWGTSDDPMWSFFYQGVELIRGERVHVAWLNHRPEVPNIPKWETVLKTSTSPDGVSVRGVQWGLAHFLEEMLGRFPHIKFLEVGIPSTIDASSSRIPLESREIKVWVHSDKIWAPVGEFVSAWPKSANRSKAFGAKASTLGSMNPNTCPVIWAFPNAEKKLGSLEKEWLQFSSLNQGVVVFPLQKPSHASELVNQLKKRGVALSRFKVEGFAEVWHWGFSPKSLDISQSLEDWSAIADDVSPPLSPVLTENGKVPYRALSKVSKPEGVSNVMLEFNMHQALMDFSRRHVDLDIDQYVSEGLGLSVDDLAERLSPEQVDAVALTRETLEVDGKGMLLSDETGFGKGRIVASTIISGLKQGKTMVFFTLNHFLFSDLYRDLLAIMPEGVSPPMPLLLHDKAVLKDMYGNVISRALTPKKFKEMMGRHDWENGQAKVIFTTYSQFSRAKNGDKIKWLKNRMGSSSWMLLDEAHGAAGNSNIGKALEELIAHAKGTLYASATYSYKAENLKIYRPALNIPNAAFRVLTHAMDQDDGVLREALTHQIAREGRLMRREHPPVPPPKPYWVEMTSEREEVVKAFSLIWQTLYDAVISYSKLVQLEEGAWNFLGGILARTAKEFSLQMKAQSLVDLIQNIVQEKNEKVVVVVDSTFESALKQMLTPEAELADLEQDEDTNNVEDESSEEDTKAKKKAPPKPQMIRSGDGAPPLWKDRLLFFLENVCPKDVWENMASHQEIESLFNKTQSFIEQLPDWDLSPLDRVRNALKNKGIESGELSGRDTRLIIKSKGWEVINRKDPERNTQVASFNAGEFDVMFVTRSGAAGISLHAGKKFKDQRKRTLIEWDISNNPVVRVQFWGRVRRKDQVLEPDFLGICFDTPEDRRLIEREKRKFNLLSAHAGQAISENVGLLSELGEEVIKEWAAENPSQSFKLGIKYPVKDNPIGRVDRALIRSLILPFEQRQKMLNHLERGVEVGADFYLKSIQSQAIKPSRMVQHMWWWGDSSATLSDPSQALSFLRMELVERVWLPQEGATPEKIYQALAGADSEPTGADVVALWKKAWEHIQKTPHHLSEAKWVVSNLTELKVGDAIIFTHPFSRRPTRAIILGWNLPLGVDSNNWSLFQVGLKVFPVGDIEPLNLSLGALAHDTDFKNLKVSASVSWYKEPPVPLRSLSMEGHPVQSAAWGRRWNVGKSALIMDEDHGNQVVWLLPPTFTWSQAQALPRDLVDFKHALSFLKHFEGGVMTGALPHPYLIKAVATKAGLSVEFNPNAWDFVTRNWLDVWTAKKLKAKKSLQGGAMILLPWNLVSRTLAGWSQNGLDWRISSDYLDWYKNTSAYFLK